MKQLVQVRGLPKSRKVVVLPEGSLDSITIEQWAEKFNHGGDMIVNGESKITPPCPDHINYVVEDV